MKTKPDPKPDPMFELGPDMIVTRKSRGLSPRSIGQLMTVVALSGLVLAALPPRTRPVAGTRAARRMFATVPAPPPRFSNQTRPRRSPLQPSSVIVAREGIDEGMIVTARRDIDEAMIFNPERAGRVPSLLPPLVAPMPPGPWNQGPRPRGFRLPQPR